MAYQIPQGVQVSLDYNPVTQSGTWYKLSDHNRQPIGINYTLIESTDRMANGTLRKYIVARKFVITVDWTEFPTLDSNVVDYIPALGDVPSNPKAAAWIKAFYEGNYGNPVYVKLMFAQEAPVLNSVPSSTSYLDSKHSTGQVYNAYMTSFNYTVSKRRQLFDYVDLKIEFTEI